MEPILVEPLILTFKIHQDQVILISLKRLIPCRAHMDHDYPLLNNQNNCIAIYFDLLELPCYHFCSARHRENQSIEVLKAGL